MRAIAPFVLQVIALQLTRCQGDSGVNGGPSTFGYDASSACSKPHSRRARSHYENLPCDFRRQNWCMIAGSSYPWRAVRQFVQENQGLMRRMYGDENYISVFQTELEKNDIELKYDYRHHFTEDSRQFQYDEYELIDDDRSKININEYEGREFTSRSFNDPIAKRMNKFSKLSEYTRPHFRPTERTTSSTTSSTTTSSSTSPSTLTSSTIFGTRATSSSTTPVSIITMTSTEEVKTSTSQKFSNIIVEVVDPVINNTTTMSSPSVTVAQIVREQNFSINEIPGQNDRIDVNPEEFIETSSLGEMTVKKDTTLKPIETTTSIPMKMLVNQEKEEEEEEEEGMEVFSVTTKTTVQEDMIAAASHEQQQEFRPRPEYRPSDVTEASASTGGQLYQDATKAESQGVHACPVKIEVVAPFWANNTRGEVLALLNLYPFEQYVHWEKCVNENKQMLCRDGCKCIQQYRLHRLLAYDPNNECRGIFSDWFRFPSCCICYCFDTPLQFRVASRSPRASYKQRIKVRPPMREHYP